MSQLHSQSPMTKFNNNQPICTNLKSIFPFKKKFICSLIFEHAKSKNPLKAMLFHYNSTMKKEKQKKKQLS